MLSVLMTVMLVADPEQRLDRRGRPITTALATVIDAEGVTVRVSLIAMTPPVVTLMAALKHGDEVAIAGHASMNAWATGTGQSCTGLNVKVRRILTMSDAGMHLMPHERRDMAARKGQSGND